MCPLGGEAKLALLGDPMPGTPNYDPSLDMQPQGAQGGLDFSQLADVEKCIVNTVRLNTENAIGRDFWRKQEWMMYEAMAQGIPTGDDPTSPLVQLGYHCPILARYEQQMRIMLMNALFPSEDWFELKASPLWGGLDNLSEVLTDLLRRKFENMTPHATNGFYNTADLMLAQFNRLGTCLGLKTYDVLSDPFEPGNEDGLIDGPTLQWVDIFNAFFWRDDVNSPAETFTDIYDPIVPENIERMGFANLDQILEKEQPKPLYNRYVQYQSWSAPGGMTWNPQHYFTLPAMEQYERWLGLGKFPFAQVRKQLANVLGTEFSKTMPSAQAFQILMQMLGPKFGFDPMAVNPDTWFEIQRVGDVLASCKPYAVPMPRGKGPLVHDRLYINPGYLWGEGVYKRYGLDERIVNDIIRNEITIVKWTGKGLFGVREDQMDDEYREHRGSQSKWEPGDQVPLKSGVYNQPFIEKLETNERALPMLGEMKQALMAQMQTGTSINNDVQGQSNAKTATQSANNLQQSLSISDGIAKHLEGMFREIVARAYVIMRTACQMTGFVPPVTLSAEEGMVQQIQISPNDIATLNFIEIKMMGRNSPGNKMQQAESFMQGVQIFLPTGAMNIIETLKMWVKLMGISGGDNLIVQTSPQDLQMYMQNLVASGVQPQQAISWLAPSQQQQIGMMMNPQGMGAGGPGGPGGPPMPPDQQGDKKGKPGKSGPPKMLGSSNAGMGPPMMGNGQ